MMLREGPGREPYREAARHRSNRPKIMGKKFAQMG